jgi:putative transposase
MSAFIDQHRNRITAEGLKWGVEPICAVLPIAPATYYAAILRRQDPDTFTPRCPRRLADR